MIKLILFATLFMGCNYNGEKEMDKSISALDTLISAKHSELSNKFRVYLFGWKKVKPYIYLNEVQNQFIKLRRDLKNKENSSFTIELNNTLNMIDTIFAGDSVYANEIITSKTLLSAKSTQVLNQNIRVAELIILDKILNECSKNKFAFNKYKVIVEPQKTNVKIMEEYQAKIYLAAYDTTYDPRVLIFSKDRRLNTLLMQDGAGVFKSVDKTKGIKHWDGIYRLKSNDGMKEVDYPFEFNLTVE